MILLDFIMKKIKKNLIIIINANKSLIYLAISFFHKVLSLISHLLLLLLKNE